MSEALLLNGRQDPSPRQVELAKIMLRGGFDSKVEALLEARYSPSTARAQGRRTLQSVGVIRALADLKKRQSDRATGLLAVRDAALATGVQDVRSLAPIERLQVGVAYARAASEIQVEEVPADDAAQRVRAQIARAFDLGRRWQASRNKRPNSLTFASETGIDNQGESLQVIDASAVDSDNA